MNQLVANGWSRSQATGVLALCLAIGVWLMGVTALALVSVGMVGAADLPDSASAPQAVFMPSGRFVPTGDVVTDRVTGLVWQRCSFGQRWSPELGCVGLATKLWFKEAQRLASKTWRLPALHEARALYNEDLTALSDPVAFPDAPTTWYWAVGPQGQAMALGVSCGSGGNDSCYQSDARAVRLVRRGRAEVMRK